MSATAEPILFEAVSTPSQSLSARGMQLLCLLSAAGAAVPGVLFLVLGAWPVLGFLGVEVTLVLGLVALHRRWSARAREVVRLTETQLHVVTANGRGGVREAVLQPYWTRVALEEVAGGVARLSLVQRGRRVEVGCFLSDAEKRDLGEALGAALRRYREPVFDNPQLH
ncbi:DUF2244 domain-containing protein [Falsiroseomonas sp.]|uniref:DUF2244 domain-containing protein n=1 Tax=Falsiroseomonas sp. TaxID=2870721 RepID=UPI002723EA84|nr:DUF2244 domain-containing protein [Falsiroseomonas sp.]MDO9503161.1 DUF2244 domain-containing protein [Falsiroseomonas sp.]MDP3417540.1 DUF2244 domain-containing protein [Falsiroseomonas sp.]